MTRLYGENVTLTPVIEHGELRHVAADVAGMTPAQIAERIRRDLLAAQLGDQLPVRVTFRVTSSNARGHRVINITILGCPDAWLYTTDATGERQLSFAARELQAAVERHHAAYNWDGGDKVSGYSDRNYYGGVTFEDDQDRRYKAAQDLRSAVDVYRAWHASGGRLRTVQPRRCWHVIGPDGTLLGAIAVVNTRGGRPAKFAAITAAGEVAAVVDHDYQAAALLITSLT